MPLPVFAALASVSVAAQLLSANAQAKAIQENAKFAAAIAELNAKRAEIDSIQSIRDGRAQEARYLTQVQGVQDAQTAAFASQGVEVKADATGDLIAESSLNAALNIIDIRNAAFQNYSKFQSEANQRRSNAAIGLYNADNEANATRIAGYVGALSSVAGYTIKGMELYGGDGSAMKTTTGPVMTPDRIRSGLAPKPLELTNELGLFAGHNHWNNIYS